MNRLTEMNDQRSGKEGNTDGTTVRGPRWLGLGWGLCFWVLARAGAQLADQSVTQTSASLLHAHVDLCRWPLMPAVSGGMLWVRVCAS